jgi:hypothetical protein
MAARALALALILLASAVALAGLYEALAWLEFRPPARGIVGQLRPIIIAICLLVAMAGLFTFLVSLATAQLSAAEALRA